MTQRSKVGVFKPKIPFTSYTTIINSTDLPTNVSQALNSPIWKKAMKEEFDALIKKNTWNLVHASPSMNIVE